MNDTCICDNAPKVWRLTGVTRTLRLRIFNPDGTPLDLTGRTVAVTIARDNSEFIYAPGFVIEGDDNNVVKFEWPADQQGAGDYTINVTTTDGSGNVDRVNWHGPTGIRLVDFSFMVRGEDALGVTSEANIGLDGTFTMNGTGMSAYDEWLAEGHTGTPEDFIVWLRQPAEDAATEAEATVDAKMAEVDADMAAIEATAAADHTRAENDHTTATGDHTRAEADHAQAVTDSQQAATDHQQAEIDAAAAAIDREKAAADRTKAADDRQQAAADHATAAQDHATASSDHQQAQSDHSTASADHTQAVQDAEQAASDHTRAGDDHDTAVADHQQAEADHTRAEADHTTAAADHTTAAADHTQATADHEVMAGYDTRLGNVEGDVSQLGQDITGLTLLNDGKYYAFSSQNAVVLKLVGEGYYTVSIKVSAGMQFKIKGAGGSSAARLWIMADKDQMALSAADASAIADGLVLTIGNNVEYLYINIANASTAPYVRQLTSGSDILNSLALAQSIDDDLHDLTIDYFAAGQNLLSGNYLNASSKVWEDGLYGADTYCGGSTTTKSMVRPFRLPKGVYMLFMTSTTSRYLLYDKRWNLIATGSNGINKITITDDFAYIVISCLTANVASLRIISAVPVLKDVLLPQSDSELLSLAKSENAFNTDAESLLNDMSITNSDYVTGYWLNGVWQSSNKSTPLIPIKRGTKLDVFFWSATTPSASFGVTVLKNGKWINTYTCDLVADETSIMSKTSRVHSTSTLYKAHFPADYFNADGMAIQISGTTAICKMGNIFLFTYGSSLVMQEPASRGLYCFDDLSTQKVFPMTVTGTAGEPSAKYELSVPLSDNFNVRFKFRITDAIVNGDYAWAPVWAANTPYSVDTLVWYSGVMYICKTAHTSSSSFDRTKWDYYFYNVASLMGARVEAFTEKLSQITSTYTYNGTTYTSYYPSFSGGIKYNKNVSLDNRKYKTYLGDFAMSVRYTGIGASASIENTGTAFIIKVDGSTVATLDFATYDTMAKIYEAIKALTGFSVDFGEIVNRTPQELAKFGEIQLISTYYGNIEGAKPTDNNQVQYTDNAPLFLPYAVASEWAQAEIVGFGNNIYVCVDGITTKYKRKMESVAKLTLGGVFGVQFKDIEIDLTSVRDAEIESNYNSTSRIADIVISSVNPYTVIFEGHGMANDIAESESYPGDEMSATAEWLQRIFNAAFEKEYVPVRLVDIIAHYKIGTPLPKRCFTAIFDDYRFGNFLGLKNRSVFTRNGVFASLAVISNEQTPITYNGETITLEKAIAIGKNAGFECYSHTKDHRYMESEKPSDYITLAQGDIYDGDEKGINPNILIFPYGNNTAYLIDTLRWLGYQGGVTIDVGNPLGNNAWCLVRQEVGVRANITDIINELL